MDKIDNAADKGIFLKDPEAKEFVRSPAGIRAGWKVLHGHMSKYTRKECYDHIEDYVARLDGGLTKRCMRMACRLHSQPSSSSTSPSVEPPAAVDPTEARMNLLRTDTGDIIRYMLDNDMDAMTEYEARHCSSIKGNTQEHRKQGFQGLISHGFL